MDIQPILDKLFSLHQFGIKLGLETTENLLKQIGNPHKNLKCFHIAGSNGKGSTSSFIASILMEHGYKVGLYTSPHFVKFNERIKINGEEIPDEIIVDFVSMLSDYIDEQRPTFFELTTALAFKYFEDEQVDYAVIETGLGGRLDATNVINPVASVITSISLEHTSHLGDTIEKIAFEKSGIIKNSKPVFLGNISDNAFSVIEFKAKETQSRLYKIDNFAHITDGFAEVLTEIGTFKIYETPLKGVHQLKNSALAAKTIFETIENANPLLVSKGITNVIKNTKIEGRYEIFSNKPRIIFDSAHNPEGVQTFLTEFKNEYLRYARRELIFGAMRDKNIKVMLNYLAPYFDKIYISSISDERAVKFDEINALMINPTIKFEQLTAPEVHIRYFHQKEENECLVVLGSMYLLGEIKSKILKKRLDIKGGGV